MPDDDGQIPKWGIAVFGIYLIVLNLTMLVLLLYVWPITHKPEDAPLWNAFGFAVQWGTESHYVIFWAVCGALGSCIHMSTSFADSVGNRQLRSSSLWWLTLRPFVGIALAIALYLGVSIVVNGDFKSVNAYAMAFFAVVMGMLSKQISEKISEAFDLLFGTRSMPARVTPIKSDPNLRVG